MALSEPDPIVSARLVLPNPRFQRSLVGWVRRFIDELPRGSNARPTQAEDFKRQSAALDALASFIGEQEVGDPRLFLLAKVAGAQPGDSGWVHRKDFEPTRSQSRIFCGLGIGVLKVGPDAALAQLVSAGVADTLGDHNRAHAQFQQERNDADVARQAAEAKVAPLAEAEAARDRLSAQLEAEQQQITKLRKRVGDLEGFVLAAADSDSADQRRTKVDGQVGIYFRDVDGESIYEINWQEDGRTRWRTVGPDLDEARKLRAELAGKSGADDQTEPRAGGQEA